MNFKNILIILILIINLICVSSEQPAYTLDDLTWEGYISVNLDKTIFNPDEEVKGHLIIENGEHKPLLGQRIILQLAKGEYDYPSMLANDNIIFEQLFEDNWILPRTIKKIEFNLGQLNPGEYHLDVYSWVLKTMFVGSDAILYNPVTINFKVSGENEETEIYINRKLTNFGKEKSIGPNGFPVEAGQKFSGEVYITNQTTTEKNNLTINIEICDWSKSFCNGELFDSEKEKISKTISVSKLLGKKDNKIDVELTAPLIPSVYEISITLKENEKILSIYKNRVIVTGGTSKIRKVLFGGLENKEYSLEVLFAGSPDHFTYPDFENFNLKMSVFNNEKLINEKEENYSKITTGEVKSNLFKIEEKEFDRICIEINKDNIIYDKECFSINLEGIQKDYDEKHPELMDIKYNYNSTTEELTLTLTKKVLNEINGRIRILKENNTTLINEVINHKGIFEKNYLLNKENYTLMIDDFDSKRQKVIYLNLSETDSFARDENNLNSCGGIICPSGTVCDSKTYNSSEGDCCTTNCIPSIESSGVLGILTIPLIFWIGVILLIFSGIILFNTLKNRGNKK